MNYCDFQFDDNTKATLEKLVEQNRLPHAIIIEGKDKKKCSDLAIFLSMVAVCREKQNSFNKFAIPCGTCGQCVKARQNIHPDILYPVTVNKSATYSIDQIRDIIADAIITPNEAPLKIYVFESAEKRFQTITQNAILKLIEEPPQNILFIFICENANGLLTTILSRCSIIKIDGNSEFSEKSVEIAKKVANALVSPKEWDLMFEFTNFTDKTVADEVLSVLPIIFRDCVAYQNNAKTNFDDKLAEKLSKRITVNSAVQLIEISNYAKNKIQQNVNINLLATWLCGEYRRILWQR